MKGPQTFSGVGLIYRPDGTCLEGERRFSFTLLPYDLPAFGPSADGRAATRPGTMGCWVELRGSEPLALEGEPLRLRMGDGRAIRFHLFDVSEVAPHLHTAIIESWPEAVEASAHDDARLRHSA